MKKFRFRVINSCGTIISDTIYATSKNQATFKLETVGLCVLELVEVE